MNPEKTHTHMSIRTEDLTSSSTLIDRDGVMRIVVATNLVVRLCLELATYGVLGYWGGSINGSMVARISLAIAAPLAAIVVWSQFLSPKARWKLGKATRRFLELSIFVIAAIALTSSGQVFLAIVFVVTATLSSLLFHASSPIHRVKVEDDRD